MHKHLACQVGVPHAPEKLFLNISTHFDGSEIDKIVVKPTCFKSILDLDKYTVVAERVRYFAFSYSLTPAMD